MGKFDGVLLISDYDNTFGVGNEIPPENLELLAYFQSQGGRFTIATGRTHCTFRKVRPLIPLNAPALLANGALIYDFEAEQTLAQFPLPATVREDMAQLARDFPQMALEVYSGDRDIYAWNPNPFVRQHLERTGADSHFCPIEDIPFPWDKAIMEQSHSLLVTFQAQILSRWGDRYEAIFSDEHMLELNAKGCTKGSAALALADLLGIDHQNVYCVGDHENDLSMLEASAIPFAPANCIPQIRALPGVHLLPPCQDGAIAQLIRELDQRY